MGVALLCQEMANDEYRIVLVELLSKTFHFSEKGFFYSFKEVFLSELFFIGNFFSLNRLR